MTTQQITGPVFFKLKDAKDYGFWNRGGQRRLKIEKGDIVTMHSKADIEYFRARPDVIIECTEDGTPINELGHVGHLIPGKSKSHRVYGRRGNAQPVAPKPEPNVVQVGRVIPKVTRLDRPVPKVTRLEEPGPRVIHVADIRGTPRPVASQTPGEALSGIPAERPGDLSPLEMASPDGSTRVVRPQVDPGQ